MRSHYDFSKMRVRRNPYVQQLKKAVTIRLDQETVRYFKALADQTGLPYQSLINLYLRDCAVNGRRLAMQWKPQQAKKAAVARKRVRREPVKAQ